MCAGFSSEKLRIRHIKGCFSDFLKEPIDHMKRNDKLSKNKNASMTSSSKQLLDASQDRRKQAHA